MALTLCTTLQCTLPHTCSMTRAYTATERNDSKLYRPEWTAADGDYIFANSSSWPSQRNAVSRPIHIGNAQWELYLEPQGGWRPSWEHGAIAAVVLGSAVLALLVATIMALWAQQQRLLGDVLVRACMCVCVCAGGCGV